VRHSPARSHLQRHQTAPPSRWRASPTIKPTGLDPLGLIADEHYRRSHLFGTHDAAQHTDDNDNEE